MKTTTRRDEHVALQSLLMIVVEIQNTVRRIGADAETELDVMAGFDAIEQLVESVPAQEWILMARAALATPPQEAVPANRKTFYGIVSQQDLPLRVFTDHTPRGPILMETYLDADSAERSKVEAQQHRFSRYGWSRVASITVDFPPDVPVAIPAAAASVHE